MTTLHYSQTRFRDATPFRRETGSTERRWDGRGGLELVRSNRFTESSDADRGRNRHIMWGMGYDRVNRSHVVPAGYLSNFALNGMLQMRLLGSDSSESVLVGVRNAAVRSRFYIRNRPDGTRIDDIEASFQPLENRTAPILRDIAGRWLCQSDKQALAELFAVQYFRGPRWLKWYESLTRSSVDAVRDFPQSTLGTDTPISDAELESGLNAFLSPTWRLTRMIYHTRKLTMALASMHWSLIEFQSPVVATSDDPVVFWPRGEPTRKPSAANVAVMDTLEVRVPVSPRHAILMTWLGEEDWLRPIAGRRDHAMNINAFTIAQTDRQWFYLPGTKTPPRSSGRLSPLSRSLIPGYDPITATSSIRYRGVREILDRRRGEPLGNQELEIVVVSRSG